MGFVEETVGGLSDIFRNVVGIFPTVEGKTYEVGPVCLKESDEEIHRYFQNLLVDDYPIDYQIEVCREFGEYSSFTTADDVEYITLKFKVE